MTGIRPAAALALISCWRPRRAIAADEPDELMPGRIVLIRYGVLAKFVAKATAAFDLPDASNAPIGGRRVALDLRHRRPGRATRTCCRRPDGRGSAARRLEGLQVQGRRQRRRSLPGRPRQAEGREGRLQGRRRPDRRRRSPATSASCSTSAPTRRATARGFGGDDVRNDATLLKREVGRRARGVCPTPGGTTTIVDHVRATTRDHARPHTVDVDDRRAAHAAAACSFSCFISDGVSGGTCGTIRNADGSPVRPARLRRPLLRRRRELGPAARCPRRTTSRSSSSLTSCTGQTATSGRRRRPQTGSQPQLHGRRLLLRRPAAPSRTAAPRRRAPA